MADTKFEYRIETTIDSEGILHLEDLPFTQGDKVEIIILKQNRALSQESKQRTVGDYVGKIIMADDFDAPLPDDFWLDTHTYDSKTPKLS